MNLKGKKVCLTGAGGMVSYQLIDLLKEKGSEIYGVGMDDPERLKGKDIQYTKLDLRHFDNCLKVTKGMDILIHTAGIKGSPQLTKTRPCDFFVPTIQFNTNILEAARINNIEFSSYFGTVGEYGECEVFKESEMWDLPVGRNDKFAGWSKRMAELQIEGYKIQYPGYKASILRLSNIHGIGDNFDEETAMVIPSTIRKVLASDGEITMWSDGSQKRNFVNSKDAASACVFCIENEVQEPVNVTSGELITIKELAETIIKCSGKKIKINWDLTKPGGDKIRYSDISRIKSYGWEPRVKLEDGIKELMDWYVNNKDTVNNRYNVFKEK